MTLYTLPRFSRIRAFNMLEMLIALTIVITLASILVPGLSRIQQQAVWAKIPGQMKTIVVAFHDYALDHNNYFPPAYIADSDANTTMGEDVSQGSRWLDSTIYSQVYPDSFEGDDDTEDTTTADYGGGTGSHLEGTVFLVAHAAKKFSDNKNLYDHSFCLNRNLTTDSRAAQGSNPELSPRNRSMFVDDTRTMLIIEGSEGALNSIASGEEAQIVEAQERYNGKYVHVGFMDGHVERMRANDEGSTSVSLIPRTDTDEDGAIFWRGVHPSSSYGEAVTPDY